MGPVRIGFVGAGTMGQMAHLRNYAVLEDCTVTALAEPRERTAQAVAQRYGIKHVYRDHRQMLEAEELDGVVAVQPFEHHAALLPELYAKVPRVFTEKPLALSVEAGERLVRQAAADNCVHMVGYHKRCDPAAIAAVDTISEWRESGEMGRMTYVRILMPAGDWIAAGFEGRIDAGDPRPAMPLESSAEGMDGPMLEMYRSLVNYYVHQVNFMRFVLGEPFAVTYVESSGVLMAVQSRSGVPGILEMSPYRTTRAWEEEVLVAFERGCIRLQLPAPLAVHRAGRLEIYEDPGGDVVPRRLIPTLEWEDAMHRQAATFVQVCRGARPPCTAREALEDLKVLRDYVRLRFGQPQEQPSS